MSYRHVGERMAYFELFTQQFLVKKNRKQAFQQVESNEYTYRTLQRVLHLQYTNKVNKIGKKLLQL